MTFDPRTPPALRLEPWTEADLALLIEINAPEMTEFLGGPESQDRVLARHRRYLALNAADTGQMFRITVGPEWESAGSVGYWDHESDGVVVAEVGWSVLPRYQGQGVAVGAMRALVPVLREVGRYPRVHAYPRIEHTASNAVCRRAGFSLGGVVDFEYPAGHPILSNDWSLDLT